MCCCPTSNTEALLEHIRKGTNLLFFHTQNHPTLCLEAVVDICEKLSITNKVYYNKPQTVLVQIQYVTGLQAELCVEDWLSGGS